MLVHGSPAGVPGSVGEGVMRFGIAEFLKAEGGAAVMDWVLLAASLTALLVVALGTATGVLVPQRALAKRAPVAAMAVIQVQPGPGS